MQAKKSLGLPRGARAKWGQNFLRNKGILKKIADFAQIEKEDTVVEVGPGEGTLTDFLLEKSKKVIAIEKDVRMVEFLEEKFAKEIKEEKLEIVCSDVLKLPDNFFSVFFEEKLAKPEKKLSGGGNYKLVGNIPYYITGALFKKVLSAQGGFSQPKSITFVVQKEVAERIAARDGKESILSISIKVYGTPEYGGVIKAGSFSPKPKVDSAIIAVRNISKDRFKNDLIPARIALRSMTGRPNPSPCEGEGRREEKEKKFFEILKAGFAHKRKLLIKNLISSQTRVSRTFLDILKMKEVFEKCGIPEKARAEDLKVEDWLAIAKELM